MPGAASRVPAAEGGLAFPLALAWAPELHSVGGKKCKALGFLWTLHLQAGGGWACPRIFLPSSLAAWFGGQGRGCRARAAWIRTSACNLDASGPLCFSALTSEVGTAAGPTGTGLTWIPFPNACTGSGAGACAGTGWLSCALVGHATKSCPVGERREGLGLDPAPSPTSNVIPRVIGKMGTIIMMCPWDC